MHAADGPDQRLPRPRVARAGVHGPGGPLRRRPRDRDRVGHRRSSPSYAVFGHRRPLNAVIVAGIVLLANMSMTFRTSCRTSSCSRRASLFLLIQMHAFDERATWIRRRIGDPTTISSLYLRGGTVFILAAMLGSLLLTQRAASSPLGGRVGPRPRPADRGGRDARPAPARRRRRPTAAGVTFGAAARRSPASGSATTRSRSPPSLPDDEKRRASTGARSTFDTFVARRPGSRPTARDVAVPVGGRTARAAAPRSPTPETTAHGRRSRSARGLPRQRAAARPGAPTTVDRRRDGHADRRRRLVHVRRGAARQPGRTRSTAAGRSSSTTRRNGSAATCSRRRRRSTRRRSRTSTPHVPDRRDRPGRAGAAGHASRRRPTRRPVRPRQGDRCRRTCADETDFTYDTDVTRPAVRQPSAGRVLRPRPSAATASTTPRRWRSCCAPRTRTTRSRPGSSRASCPASASATSRRSRTAAPTPGSRSTSRATAGSRSTRPAARRRRA